MSDREALYAAILAHPDEDTPRLVFADWLQENGNERYATFIRKQIELARVPEWDPLWLRAWRDDRGAINGYDYDDFRPALGVGLSWEWFRRGFGWRVKAASAGPFLERAERLFAQAPVGAVTFNNLMESTAGPFPISAVVGSPWLARLSQLTFDWIRFVPNTARAFAACPHLGRLKRLTFSSGTFESGALAALLVPALLNRLDALELLGATADWGEFVRLADYAGSGRLRRFVASSPYAPSAAPARLFAAPVLSELCELRVHSTGINSAHVRAVCEAPFAPRLESLTLAGTSAGLPGVEAVAACAALRGLKRLDLSKNQLGPLAVKRLAESPHLAGLSVLNLSDNPFGDAGAVELANAPWLKNLAGLDLSHCDITARGAFALAEAFDPQHLVRADLNSARVTVSYETQKALAAKFGPAVYI